MQEEMNKHTSGTYLLHIPQDVPSGYSTTLFSNANIQDFQKILKYILIS